MTIVIPMASVFDLPSADREFAPVSDSLRTQWTQHQTKGASTGDNFFGAPLVFEFQASGNTWWQPSQSFIRIRGKIAGKAGADVSLADGVAPAMCMPGAMFQNAEHQINNVAVSRVDHNHDVVNAMCLRSMKSQSMLDSINKDTVFMQPWFEQRSNAISRDGTQALPGGAPAKSFAGRVASGFDAPAAAASNSIAYAVPVAPATYGIATFAQNGGAVLPNASAIYPAGSYFSIEGQGMFKVVGGAAATLNLVPLSPQAAIVATSLLDWYGASPDSAVIYSRRSGEFEINYRPCLGLWQQDFAIPGSNQRLTLMPQSAAQFQTAVVESLVAKVAGPAADYNVTIDDCFLYACMVTGDVARDGEYGIQMVNLSVQTSTGLNANSGQKDFTVPKSTYQLAVAYQDTRSSADTRYPSTRFVAGEPGEHAELALSDLQVIYANQTQPTQRIYPSVQGNKDWGTTLYYNTQLVIGGTSAEGGAEDIREFRERGSYYAFVFDKPPGDVSTDVQVQQSFDQAYPGLNVALPNMRLLLFSWYTTVAKLSISGGAVKSVNTFQV